MTPIQIDCSIADDLKRRITERRSGRAPIRSIPGVLGPVILGIDSVLQLSRSIARHQTAMTVIYGVLLVAALALIVVWFLLPKLARRWPFATRVAAVIDDTGIAGTLDGRAIAYRWRDVTSIEDVGEALMLLIGQGPFGKRFVIPREALPDPARFWSELDDRLVAKRGLVGTRTATRIVNTALR